MQDEQTNKTQSGYIDRLRRAHGAETSSGSSHQPTADSALSTSAASLPMPPTTRDIAAAQSQKRDLTKQRHPGGCKVVIEDQRQPDHFAGVTFSLYKRTQVKKSLVDAMTKGAIEESNYWGAELVCCGCFLELWEVLFEFMSRNVGMSNPKMPVIVAKCFADFKQIAMGEFSTNQLGMRNSAKVRKIFAKVISLLCTSRKRGKLEYVKVDKDNDFDILKLSTRMKAPSAEFSNGVMLGGDPTEIGVAVNEFCYHISKNVRNHLMADYWVEWLLEFDKICRKKKERCQCARRDFAPQEDDGGKDVSFVLWDALLREGRSRPQKPIVTIMCSILELFKVRFSVGVKKRRRHMLYFAVSLLCEPLDLATDTIHNESALVSVLANLDVVYGQVKQGESSVIHQSSPKTGKKKTAKATPSTEEQRAAKKMDILLTMGIDEASG